MNTKELTLQGVGRWHKVLVIARAEVGVREVGQNSGW